MYGSFKASLLSILVVFCSFPNTPSSAAIVTTATGNGADSRVLGETNQGTTNFGTAPDLYVQDFSTTSSWLTYIRFDLAGYAPGGYSAATFTITRAGTFRTNTFRIHGLHDSLNADNWGETTITYQNAPGLTFIGFGSQDVDPAEATLLGTAVASTATITFSGPALDAFLNADTDGLVTLILSDSAGSSQGAAFIFASKEHTTLPEPQLEFTNVAPDPVPEPSTLALAALGLAGLGLVARRCPRPGRLGRLGTANSEP